MPPSTIDNPTLRTPTGVDRWRGWALAACLCAALSGCAGGSNPASDGGRSAGGVEVFGTVDIGAGRTR
jgi:hypothetical protein